MRSTVINRIYMERTSRGQMLIKAYAKPVRCFPLRLSAVGPPMHPLGAYVAGKYCNQYQQRPGFVFHWHRIVTCSHRWPRLKKICGKSELSVAAATCRRDPEDDNHPADRLPPAG
eukprot:g51103.t1